MRKLRIVLKEEKNNNLLKEASYFSGRSFDVHKQLREALNSKKPQILTEIESLETITAGHPKSISLDSYTKLYNIIDGLNISLKESEGPGKFTQILNDFSKVDLFLISVNELRSFTSALQEYYRATVYPFHVDDLLNNNKRYYNLIETVNNLYGRELTLTLQQIDGYLKKLNAGAGEAEWKKLLFGASEKQKKELVNLIAKSIASFISRVVEYKYSSERYSNNLIAQLNGAEGGGGTTTPPTTTEPSTPPTTTEPSTPPTGEPPTGEESNIGSNNPVPLFNKGSTSDSLLSAMLMGMNQRIQNNSKDGKGLILSTTDDKKIRLIDAFKNYDKLTPNSKKFVDQIQFIMKDLAGQLKANGIRIQEAATPILNRTINPAKKNEKFRTSSPETRGKGDSNPEKRASGEAGGGLEMVTPVVGSVDVRRAIYRKILRAIKVLVGSSGDVFKGNIDDAAMNIADGAAKVAIKFLVSNLSQRGVNVTDKRSKVKVPAKNVGKNYGKKGDPDAGKEKNITLLENKSSKLLKEYREHIETKLIPYMQKQVGFNKPPVINFLDDTQNASDPFGKTAFYDPQSMEISVYTTGRHPKDIMRSVAHEVIHHAQNCRGQLDPQRMGEASEGYAQNNPYLRKLEEEAYLLGNMTFRDWEDGMKNNQLNEMHDCNKVHPNKSHAAYKRDDEAKEEKSLEEWKNEERWDLLMKRFGILSEKDKKSNKSRPDYLDFDEDGNEDEPMKQAIKQAKGKK